METKQMMSVEEILNMMEQGLGEEPKPMKAMSKMIPEWIPRQAGEKKFVMEELSHIPGKYKHLIMIAAAAVSGSSTCTRNYMKSAQRAGLSHEEIAEALLVARFALASTVFATSLDGMELLLEHP